MKNKAPRNKTIDLNDAEIALFSKRAIKLVKKVNIEEVLNKTIWQDSFEAMELLPENSVDLIIVDPPYNLTKSFSSTIFRETNNKEYKKWLDKWLKKAAKLLKNNGSIYICSDWKTSIAIPEIAEKYFVLQNRISWEREKGRGAKNNWKNCLEDIWFFTKSDEYVFNLENVKIQRPVIAPYKDKEIGRAHV